jgi:charged multivesicular body protein 1
MRQVTGSMANVVKGMDSAMKAMDLERVCIQFEAVPSTFLWASSTYQVTDLGVF